MTTPNDKLLSFADAIVALEDGRIIEAGTLQSFLDQNRSVVKLGLNSQEKDFDLRDAYSGDTTMPLLEDLVVESLPSTPENQDEHDQVLDAKRKQGDWSVYSYYLSSSSYSIVILFLASMAIWVFCTELATVWLKWWSEANEREADKDAGIFMGVYTFLGLFGVIAIAISC
ncbi:hypothetical protein NHJ13051_008721 [Beauveria bassiana]